MILGRGPMLKSKVSRTACICSIGPTREAKNMLVRGKGGPAGTGHRIGPDPTGLSLWAISGLRFFTSVSLTGLSTCSNDIFRSNERAKRGVSAVGTIDSC